MATYIRLTDYKSSDEKEQEFFNPENRYEAKQEDFSKIPGSPIAYWVSEKINNIFETSEKLGVLAEPRQGMATSDNNRFLRFWNEVSFRKIGFNYTNRDNASSSNLKWFPYNKGGEFQKWYGNQEYVVNWENDGAELMGYASELYGSPTRTIKNIAYYFRKGITYSFVSSSKFAVRFTPSGFLFDVGGSSAFLNEDAKINYILSFLNSNIAFGMLRIIAPTINFQVGDLKALPIIFPKQNSIKEQIETLTQQNIDISKKEWDSRETSWDFAQNEILRILNNEFLMSNEKMPTLETVYKRYCEYWREKFFALHKNEEELNRLFIDIYELQDELTPDVELKDITILKNEAKIVDNELVFQAGEIIKQFISYGVGVMFGRYSLDHEGLHIADTGVSLEEANAKFGIAHPTFEADDDNIIPIVDESDYFSDDMTDRFTEFVRITFGSEKLQQNIAFIEASLGKKLRAYFMKDFYIDHTKRYKKRPIYWLFSSPNATFQVLIYMHRYTPDTLNHILNDYLRPFRIRLESMRNEAMRITESEEVSPRDKTIADKKIDKIDKTLDDITEYEKLLDHYAKQRIEIDLDDGVKVNYCKFKELLFTFDKKLCK